jgi:hypothetical protein
VDTGKRADLVLRLEFDWVELTDVSVRRKTGEGFTTASPWEW